MTHASTAAATTALLLLAAVVAPACGVFGDPTATGSAEPALVIEKLNSSMAIPTTDPALLPLSSCAAFVGTFTTTQRPNDDNVILGRQVDDDTVLQVRSPPGTLIKGFWYRSQQTSPTFLHTYPFSYLF